jgi:hypothetical protein
LTKYVWSVLSAISCALAAAFPALMAAVITASLIAGD